MIMEQDEKFFCLKCLPHRKPTNPVKKPATESACNLCGYKSHRTYNLQRHIGLVHGGVPNIKEPDVQLFVQPRHLQRNELVTLDDILHELKLEELKNNFDKERVDIDVLLSLNEEEMKECLREVGMSRFGDRHRFVTRVRSIKNSRTVPELVRHSTPLETIVYHSKIDNEGIDGEALLRESEESSDSQAKTLVGSSQPDLFLPEIPILDQTNQNNLESVALEEIAEEVLSDNTSDAASPQSQTNYCQLCEDSGQHQCRRCSKNVCNLFCSIQDPSSDVESHRVHKIGDPRCITPVQSSPRPRHVGEKHKKLSDVFGISLSESIDYSCSKCNDPGEDEIVCNKCGVKVCFLCSDRDPSSKDRQKRVHKAKDARCRTNSSFECPACNKMFTSPSEISKHMETNHKVQSISEIERQLLGEHSKTVSESQESNVESQEPNNKRKRIKQNLQNVNFLDDTNDDPDWQMPSSSDNESPQNPFIKFLENESEKRLKTKRTKITEKEFQCNLCGAKLSRMDSLTRHKRLKH